MSVAFWLALCVVAFTYLGYPVVIAAWAKLRPRPIRAAAQTPSLEVLLVVHNAAALLTEKLDNLCALDYPPQQIRINVVCDGCNDATENIARAYPDQRVRVFAHALRRGKSACIGSTLTQLEGELVLFTDVRQKIDAQAARMLAAALADPQVGAASGELMLETDNGYGKGIDAYWRYEKLIRRLESASGSLIGVTGALYAARRSVLPDVPAGLILDDMFIPLGIAASGHRIVFVPHALAHDRASSDAAAEEQRKRRTLAGNYQLLHRWPSLLLPGAHPLALRLWGHKWLRLLVPWLLLFLLGANLLLASSGSHLYLLLLFAQLGAYALALAGRALPALATRFLPVRLATAFLSLNTSALLALTDYLKNPNAHLWRTTRLEGDTP